jgi:nucleoside-diphosphate-sugar epimerase
MSLTIGPVVVTGGAGFLGGFVVSSLLASGHEVVVLDRNISNVSGPVTAIRGDVGDQQAIARSLERATVVIHAAFAPPRAGNAELHRINVDATAMVARMAAEAGVQRLVIVSSTIVERLPRRHPLSSRLPLSRLDAYRRTRTDAEDAALAWRDDLAVSIARPCTFLGPGRVGAFALLFEAVRAGGIVPVLGPGTNSYQLLHVADLADGLVRLASDNHAGVFHFGAPGVTPVREQLEALVAHAATGARVATVRRGLARAALRGIELAGLPPLSDWHHASALEEDRVVDTRRAELELGWTPAFSNEAALYEAYDWYSLTRAAGRATPTTHPVPRSHRVLAGGLAAVRRVAG